MRLSVVAYISHIIIIILLPIYILRMRRRIRRGPPRRTVLGNRQGRRRPLSPYFGLSLRTPATLPPTIPAAGNQRRKPTTTTHLRLGWESYRGNPTAGDAEYRRTLRPPGRLAVERMGQGVGGGAWSLRRARDRRRVATREYCRRDATADKTNAVVWIEPYVARALTYIRTVHTQHARTARPEKRENNTVSRAPPRPRRACTHAHTTRIQTLGRSSRIGWSPPIYRRHPTKDLRDRRSLHTSTWRVNAASCCATRTVFFFLIFRRLVGGIPLFRVRTVTE